MIYMIYVLVVLTTCVFVPTISKSQLVQTLCNYFPKEAIFVVLSSLTIFYHSFIKPTGKRMVNKYVFAFLCLAVFQLFVYLWIPMLDVYKDGKFGINFWAIRSFVNIVIGVFLIKSLAEGLSNKDWIKIFKFLCWCGFFIGLYSIFQFFGIDCMNHIGPGHFEYNFINGVFDRKVLMSGFLSNHTLTGAYVALTAPLCLLFKENRYKLFLVVMACSIFLTGSLVAVVSLILSISFYLVLTKKFNILMVFALVSLLVVIFSAYKIPDFFSASGRLGWWKTSTVDVLNNRPFFGFGHGSFSQKYSFPGDKFRPDTELLSAHNDFIQELNEGGLVGLCVIIFVLFNLFLKSLNNLSKEWFIVDVVMVCCLISLCIVSFGCFPFHYPPLAVIGILYIAYIESRNINYGGIL